MFAIVKKSGKYEYLQIVENRKENGKVRQRVITTLGRMDKSQDRGQVETLIRSLSRFSEKSLLIVSGKSDICADAKKISPVLILERLWAQTGIKDAIEKLLAGRKYQFNVERAIFLTVLNRLMVSGSDRNCDRWRRDYFIERVEDLQLHHLCRAMAFLGEATVDQKDATPFSPRCNKDLIEEALFFHRRNLFSGLYLVFFDTTSIYFEGRGGETIGQRGFNKDHRPDLRQMIVGAVINDTGQPICCEMWPGKTTDVKTLIPVIEHLQTRFPIKRLCIVADRGMISSKTIEILESPDNSIPYILGTRMRKVKAIRDKVLSHPGRYQEVRPQGDSSQDPASLKVKEVMVDDTRYIVCLNPAQARKESNDRDNIVAALKAQLKKGAKSIVGNKGYRRYLTIEKDSAWIDTTKLKFEARFDGKWVLTTNTDLPSSQVALKYKELWQVERVFRDVSLLETRRIFNQRDETIRGHVFCSFLALVLRKDLQRRLKQCGYDFEWLHIKQDLKALQRVQIEENVRHFIIRTRSQGKCGKIFEAVGVAMPPTTNEMSIRSEFAAVVPRAICASVTCCY